MSIKTRQAILKCFIDLKFSVWFTLCSFRIPLSAFLFPLSPLPTYLGKIEATLLTGL